MAGQRVAARATAWSSGKEAPVFAKNAMLAVIGAMKEEVSLLRAEMTVTGEATHAEIVVTRGGFNGTDMLGFETRHRTASGGAERSHLPLLALAQCGIGKKTH